MIPSVPGVPSLPQILTSPAVAIELLTNDVLSFFAGSYGPQWGIFQFGIPVVTADSVISFDYKQDWTLSDYPVEQGAFETYDKVQLPFDARVRFAMGGSESDRQALLDSIAAIAGTTDLYDIVTPEEIYQSVNITHYDYRRTAMNGVGLIVVDVTCLEVRVTATQTFSNTKSPSASAPTNAGAVQTLDATALQAYAAKHGLQ